MRHFLPAADLQLTLCDHNALAVHLEATFGAAVVEIVDHHIDRDFYPWVQGDSRRIAFADGKPTAMSTCTLIAEAFLSHSSPHDAPSLLSEDVASLLLAVIALDSSNTSTATDRDRAAVAVSIPPPA